MKAKREEFRMDSQWLILARTKMSTVKDSEEKRMYQTNRLNSMCSKKNRETYKKKLRKRIKTSWEK